MNDHKIDHWFKTLKQTGVCFIGLGVSHRQLLALFLKKGIPVTVRDRSTSLTEEVPLTEQGVTFITGDGYLKDLKEAVIFRSPGIYFYTPELTEARHRGQLVTSELEMFFDLCPAPIYGITGSDGKTTTSSIIAEMLKESGKKVYLGGNIGCPLLSEIEKIRPDDAVVVELSSFQLISMRSSPKVAVITNITPNHLDVHATMEEYINAKKNIFIHQHGGTRTILNFDDERTASFYEEVRDEPVFFSRVEQPGKGTYLRNDGMIIMRTENGDISLFKADDIKIPGVHNIENYLAATAALFGEVSPNDMEKVAKSFSGVEHRIEFVLEKEGVRYYNDAIATSPTRTIAGLDSFDQKVILIAGGYDKHIPYGPLGEPICEKTKVLILCGQTAEKIEEAVKEASTNVGEKPVIYNEETFDACVKKANEISSAGDIVLFSPASASFDQYKNFEEKGRHFKSLVNAL